MKFLSTIALFSFFHLGINGQVFSDFSDQEIKSDIDFLYEQLSIIHPNSTELDSSKIEAIKGEFRTELYSEIDAYFIINGMLKLLNDGHSNVRFSNERVNEIIKYGEFFPFELEFFDSTAVVIGTIGNKYEEVHRREIFKINNVPIETILQDLAVVAMLDGEDNTAAKEWLSADFWFYYTLYNGFRKSYSLTYLENGEEFHEIVKAMNRNSHLKISFLEDLKDVPFEIKEINEMSVLSVSNFNQKSPYWWRRNLRSIFRNLEKENKTDLIIDLRDNGGGQENLQNILLSSLGICKTDKYDLEILKKLDFTNVKGIQNKGREKLKSLGLEKLVFRDSYGNNYKKRKDSSSKNKESLYHGELYVLIDGTTFSCASDAAAILKQHYPKTTLVGTETRGSGKVNYAGYFVHLELPNTGLVVRVPRVKYILNNEGFSPNSGVIPDIKVAMDKSDVQQSIDSQLTFLFTYLKKQSRLVSD